MYTGWVFMSMHWLALYSLHSFPDIKCQRLICLRSAVCRPTEAGTWVKASENDESLRWAGLLSVICDQSWAEVAAVRGKWGRPLCPSIHLSSFLVLAPPPHPHYTATHPSSSHGWLGQPWGENMVQSRQTIFRLTAFTFGPKNKLTKQRTAN